MGEKDRRDPDNRSLWQEALPGLSAGWNLALPIFGGVLLGYFLDKWLNTGFIFTIGLLVLGIFIGFYNLARLIQKLDREGRKRADRDPGEGKKK